MGIPRFVLLIVALAPFAASSVTAAGEPAEKTLSFARWDGEAVARAIFEETNVRRTAAGLPALARSTNAEAAARVQAEYIARARTLSHTNPAPGQRTVGDRLRSAGATWRFAAENVLFEHLLDYVNGRLVYPRPAAAGGQEFSYTPNGPALRPRTPRGLARAALDQWMNSPGHRANVLARDATQLGCAAVPVAEGKIPGLSVVYAAQVFLAPSPGPTPPPNPMRFLGR